MNVETYLRQRKALESSGPRRRELCTRCLQPDFGCYCSGIHAFDPKIRFVILHHPIERRRRVATGRMAHLCLEGSALYIGHDYSGHAQIDALISDPHHHCVMLYPGPTALDLTPLSESARTQAFPKERELVIFVIDGTWATARQTVRRSANLRNLPRICFTPSRPSNFRIRRQPAPACYSTIEAIHETIELLGPSRGFATETRQHDGLLRTFEAMVDRRLELITVKKRRTRAVLEQSGP